MGLAAALIFLGLNVSGLDSSGLDCVRFGFAGLDFAELGFAELDTVRWYLIVASCLIAAGLVRLLLVRDLVARLIALNVTGIGVLLILVALAARPVAEANAEGSSAAPDPVLQALVITGLVIAVAFTGLGAVLIRRIEGRRDTEEQAPTTTEVTKAETTPGEPPASADGGDRS